MKTISHSTILLIKTEPLENHRVVADFFYLLSDLFHLSVLLAHFAEVTCFPRAVSRDPRIKIGAY